MTLTVNTRLMYRTPCLQHVVEPVVRLKCLQRYLPYPFNHAMWEIQYIAHTFGSYCRRSHTWAWLRLNCTFPCFGMMSGWVGCCAAHLPHIHYRICNPDLSYFWSTSYGKISQYASSCFEHDATQVEGPVLFPLSKSRSLQYRRIVRVDSALSRQLEGRYP